MQFWTANFMLRPPVSEFARRCPRDVFDVAAAKIQYLTRRLDARRLSKAEQDRAPEYCT